MYPMLKDNVSITTFYDDDYESDQYIIRNADGDTFKISSRLYNALLQADGTKPLDLPNEGRRIIPKLKKYRLIQTSRFVRGEGVINRFIIFPIGKRLNHIRSLCRKINAALPVVSILILAVGIYLWISGNIQIVDDLYQWIYYGLLVVSIAFHEIGHMIAGISYGYKINDTGILLLGILPIGAYVAHEEKEDAKRHEKIQLSLAGIECNFLMAGVCLLVAIISYSLSLTMIITAIFNLVLAGLNLCPAPGLDGESALSAWLGVDSISEVANKWLLNRKRRRKLLHSGVTGYFSFCIFSFVLVSKILFRLFIILDLIFLFLDFF